MTESEIKLVESSWDYVLTNAKDAGMLFYDKLFEMDPSLKSLFRDDVRSQSQKLLSMITFAVRKLRNIDEIIADVEALGKRHKSYHVKPEHYNTVGQALLWTLGTGFGPQWTKDHEQAWIKVYTLLSTTMINTSR